MIALNRKKIAVNNCVNPTQGSFNFKKEYLLNQVTKKSNILFVNALVRVTIC